MVSVKKGKFGMYISWKGINANLPSEYVTKASELPLEMAWSFIQEKAASAKESSGRSRGGLKSAKKNEALVSLPRAPKRPVSAYLHFCADKRSSCQSKTLGSIAKELAGLWAELSDEDRKPYMKMAEASKIEYEGLKSQWIKECQDMMSDKRGHSMPTALKGNKGSKTKGLRDSTPKRTKSAYNFFCAAKRPEVSQQFSGLGEVSKELSRLWSEASSEERGIYEDMAATNKIQIEAEYSVDASFSTLLSESSPSVKIFQAPSPKKRGPSAYMLFCADHRKQIVDEEGKTLPLGETTKRLAAMWKDCDDDTRSRYQAEAASYKASAI